MITASDFLKWCQVFHVATGGNPPTTVSMQVAYDNSSPKLINEVTGEGIEISQDSNSISLGTSSISQPNALMQVNSTTKGVIPFPQMSLAQENALGALLGSLDHGMCVYNTDFETIDYYDGASFTSILAIDKLLAGTNVSLVNNMDGSLTLNASGGTSTVTSGQSAFVVVANPTDTTFSTPGETKPITISSGTFSSIVAVNFSNSVSSSTPTTQLLESGTRRILFNSTISMKMNTGIQNTYLFYLVIRTGPSSTITTTYQSEVSLTPLSTGLVSIPLNGILIMNQNDSVEIWVTNLGGTDPLQIVSLSAQAWDLTQQGYASTDDLVQGTTNLYLSQDAGSTYQNVNGLPVNAGNVPTFNTIGGKLQDSGYNISSFVKQGDSGIYFGAPVTSPFISPKMLNLYALGTAGANAQNWYNNTDNYPLFQISPQDHDNLNLNFDCYFDGSNLRSSATGSVWRINKSSSILNFQWGSATQGNIVSMTSYMTIDGSGRVTIPSGGSLETLRLGTSSPGLANTTPAISFSTNYGTGNILNLAGSGRNLGVYSNNVFLTYNLNYNNTLPGYQVVTTGDVFALEVGSSGIALKYQTNPTGGATASLSTSLLVQNNGSIQLPYLTSGSTLLAVDSGKNVGNATGFYTLGGLTFDNGGGPLLATTAPVVFPSSLSDGDYISFAGNGRNTGITNAGTLFSSYNLDWDGGAATYKFNTTGSAFTVEIGASGIFFKSATGGSAGTPVTPATGLSMDSSGVIDIPFVTNNTIMARVSGQVTTARGGSFDMGQLMLNSITAPSLTQAGRLNIVGQNTTTDSALNLYTHTDGYPLVNLVGTAHGTQYLNFDCYFDGSNGRSSSSGSNFRFNNTSNLFKLEGASGVTQGSTISFNNIFTADPTGKFSVNGVSASSIVTTDSSGFFTSVPNYGITAIATVTGSSQAMALNTRYVNNYSGGQCAYTLPAATGSGKQIALISLTTASTSGWKITANGTDKIQFMGALSVAGGVLTSTGGSATDCATLNDVASGLWVVYPAAGLNLTVT